MYKIYNEDTEELIEYTNLLTYLLDLIPDEIKLSIWAISVGFVIWTIIIKKCNNDTK